MSPPGTSPTTRVVIRRSLDDLKPHPELIALLGQPPEEQVERLARALEAGHQHDLLAEVTPAGEVLFGHAAVLAAVRAGLKELDVVERSDLAGASSSVVALAVLDGALERGGLDALQTARAIKRAHDLRPQVPYEMVRDYQRGDLDEQVALRLGLSVRNAQRYLRLLETPPEVQAAFTAGQLPLTAAERVASLSDARQAELAAALRRGENPRQAVARFCTISSGRHQKAHDALAALIKNLKRGLFDLQDRADQVRGISPADFAVVERAIALLEQVRKVPVRTPEQQALKRQALLQRRAQEQALQGPGPA